MVDPVEPFVTEAATFCNWVRSGDDSASEAGREAIVRLMRLYLAALSLPNLKPYSVNSDDTKCSDDKRDWQLVRAAIGARLPFQYYGEVFDPTCLPAEEPVIGDLADDLADVFRDVDAGLKQYELGRRQEAIWDWRFSFLHHWGQHATSAIRALHCYLADNCPESLGRSPRS